LMGGHVHTLPRGLACVSLTQNTSTAKTFKNLNARHSCFLRKKFLKLLACPLGAYLILRHWICFNYLATGRKTGSMALAVRPIATAV